jgi:hypothetical protein
MDPVNHSLYYLLPSDARRENQNGSLKSTEATLTEHSWEWEKRNRDTTMTVKATQAAQLSPRYSSLCIQNLDLWRDGRPRLLRIETGAKRLSVPNIHTGIIDRQS